MSHGHHHHDHSHEGESNLKIAFFLNFAFTIVELIGGFYTNSVAILSDALHDFGDSISLGLAWYFQKVSKKGRDHKFSYGYKRFSLLGAILTSLVLISGSIVILYRTVPRLFNPEVADSKGMIILALIGIAVNGLAVFRLRNSHSFNEKMVFLHLLEDVLGWVAVLIGAIVMHFYNLPVIDPVLSLLIVAFVLFNVYKSLRKSSKIILQGIPSDVDEDKVKNYLLGIPGVKEIHDLHIWSLDGSYNILTVHLVFDNPENRSLYFLKQTIREELEKEGIEHATLEFENPGEICIHQEC